MDKDSLSRAENDEYRTEKSHEFVDLTGSAARRPSRMDPERRKQVEKSLKRKLDARCSLFVLIYIMNYLDR